MMKKIQILIIVSVLVLIAVAPAKTDTVETPVKVFLAKADAATMAVPRWKGYMMPTNPDEIWLTFADYGPGSTHLVYTTDGGSSWQSADTWLTGLTGIDYHLSAAGDSSGNILTTFPDVNTISFRKINYPAHSSTDLEPTRNLFSVSGSYPRSNVMVEPGNNRIWIFSRATGIPTQNVRYHYSDNSGATWVSGVADPTYANEVRIGSMPYVNGRPALVVAYMSNSPPQGFRYFLWDGNQFVAEDDSQIYDGPLGLSRAFTHNVTSGDYMHVVFGLGTNLYHYWKQYNNGTGSWNSAIVDTSPYNTGSLDWETVSTVRGSELYVFYTKNTTSSASSSEVYYSKWTEADQNWTTPAAVSTHPEDISNFHPNTVMKVPESSSFIPIFWYSDISGGRQIYFNQITVDSVGSTPVTRLEIDRKIRDFKEGNATEQEVLDMIDTYNTENIEP